MKLTLGFSPCPNDTFIFDALVNHKIDTEGIEFEVFMEDVQTLNKWAGDSRLDISKISYGALPELLQNYIVLNSGGALGKGVGPLLLSKKPLEGWKADIKDWNIAIPGKNTTAHFLFSQAFPEVDKKMFLVFNQIEDAVLHEKVDAGVIIHENRFTYLQKGLTKLIDLGEYWEQTTGLPIPLGGIVAKRTLPEELLKKLDRLIQNSVEYAFKHYPEITDFVKSNAQEMDESVMRQHIDLYVNDYSITLGHFGQQAVLKLLQVFQQLQPNRQPLSNPVFIMPL